MQESSERLGKRVTQQARFSADVGDLSLIEGQYHAKVCKVHSNCQKVKAGTSTNLKIKFGDVWGYENSFMLLSGSDHGHEGLELLARSQSYCSLQRVPHGEPETFKICFSKVYVYIVSSWHDQSYIDT